MIGFRPCWWNWRLSWIGKKPAAYLGLEKSAFWNLVHGGDMPHFKVNSRVFRFRMSDVIRWAEGRKRGGIFIR